MRKPAGAATQVAKNGPMVHSHLGSFSVSIGGYTVGKSLNVI